ncbi:hypothetical protein U1Q18_032143 [Sarracenia purpurea var. burkii]
MCDIGLGAQPAGKKKSATVSSRQEATSRCGKRRRWRRQDQALEMRRLSGDWREEQVRCKGHRGGERRRTGARRRRRSGGAEWWRGGATKVRDCGGATAGAASAGGGAVRVMRGAVRSGCRGGSGATSAARSG